MSVFSSITKLAKTVTGTTKSFKKVLDLKPSISGLLLPPQVQAGLKIAGIAGKVLNVDIPTEDELRDHVEGKIEGALSELKGSGLVTDLVKNLDKANAFTTKVEEINGKLVTISSVKSLDNKSVDEILDSVDWLL